ncbi:MAG TPA: ABC transporter ATP-binding protein [Acidobacteriota bacterium]|nr:ABC transporter ATP-binding protein [Acidobacteriota bacterium]
MKKKEFNRYWKVLAPFKWSILMIFLFCSFSAGVSLAQPYIFHFIVDEIALNQALDAAAKMTRLSYAGILLLVLIFLSFLAQYLYQYRSAVLGNKITARLRYRLLRHMLHLPLNVLTQMKTGGAVARLNQDTQTVSQTVNRALVLPGISLIQAAVALFMVFFLNWKMSLAALAIIVPMGIATHLYAKRLRPLFVELSKMGSELSARSTEMFGGVRVSRIYRREMAERNAYLKIYHRMIRQSLAAAKKQVGIDSFWHIGFGLIQIIIVILGVYLIIHDEGTVGDILAIIMYSNRIMGPISQVVGSYDQLHSYLAAMDRIFEILNIKRDKLDRADAVEAPRVVRSLRIENLSFSYPGATRKAVDGVSFEVKRGQTVALVGKSGAGKSTLTDLISRFYDPQEGAIYLNGIELRDIKLKSYRGLLGMVQQDVFLFDGSVRDNIAYARPSADMEDIIAAARHANAHEFVDQLPQGYDTLIGERGVKLSGGQRQRISIARAFLADPKILILDEATSNLDTENEQAIQAALKELLKERTTFIIAHRLSTVTYADTVIVLDEGKITEMGSPEVLLAKGGAYFEMIERQRRTA